MNKNNDLLKVIFNQGDRGAIVPFSRVLDIKNDMMELKNGEYHTQWLDHMVNLMTDVLEKYIPSGISFKPRSLISVVIPNPKTMLQFAYQGKFFNCIVPPHYTNWNVNNRRVLDYISDYLKPMGFSAEISVNFPHKMLAVHCGLGFYGRNNICYSEEFGSYIQIMTYLSDIDCDEEKWFPLSRMESCEKCTACVTSCPTGAIDSRRQLINSDRCITFYDELPGEIPEWLENEVHNCIIGCIRCQDCCPGNANNKSNIKPGVVFSEEETTELLNYKNSKPYSAQLAAKIDAMGIFQEYLDSSVLPRNLSILLQNMKAK